MTFIPQERVYDLANNAYAHVSHFGALKTSPTYPVIKANFPGVALDSTIWNDIVVATGNVIVASGVGSLFTGTDAAGSVILQSVDQGVFEAGQVTVFQSGTYAGIPIANNIRRWGLMDSAQQNGLFFELNGLNFNVVSRRSGVDNIVNQASFNGDQSFTPGASNNTYRIFYSAGRAIFCRASSGQLVTLHTMVDSAFPLVLDLDLGIYYENTNVGNTTNVELRVRGASSSIFGELPTIKAKNISQNFDDEIVMSPTASLSIGEQPNGVFTDAKFTGTIDQSTTPLLNTQSYTTAIIDTDGYNAIRFVAYADQPMDISNSWYNDAAATDLVETFTKTVPLNIAGGTVARDITILSPRARYVRQTVTNNSGVNMTQTDLEVVLHQQPPTPNQLSLSTNLRDGTLVGITKSVIAGRDPTGNYQNVDITPEAALLVGDYLTEVTRGNIPGSSTIVKFGRNPNIDIGTGPEDVWNSGGVYTGQPVSTSETVDIFSSDANDTSAGTGARTIFIEGLDGSWDEQSETITMNGTTAVTSVGTYRRVFRVYVLTAGSANNAVGDITVRHTTTTANIFAVMPAGQNQTTIAAYTIPAGKTGYIKSLYVPMGRANGSAGSAQISFRIRPQGSVYRAIRYYTATNQIPVNPPFSIPIVVEEMTDIKVTVESVSDNNTQISADFEILLIDN